MCLIDSNQGNAFGINTKINVYGRKWTYSVYKVENTQRNLYHFHSQRKFNFSEILRCLWSYDPNNIAYYLAYWLKGNMSSTYALCNEGIVKVEHMRVLQAD